MKQGSTAIVIAEYFVNHKLLHHPIYAQDLGQAVEEMNDFYAQNGKGHAHKSLERSTTGREIEGTYYPPQHPSDTDFQ